MDENTFLQNTISTVADQVTLDNAIKSISDYYKGNLLEAKKKMVFNSSCPSCQATEEILAGLNPPNPDEG